jgi:hypothetical protein
VINWNNIPKCFSINNDKNSCIYQNKMEAIKMENNKLKRKSSGPTYKSPIVYVYNDVHIHNDVFLSLTSMYSEKMPDGGSKIIMSFKDHQNIPIFVTQKDLITMYKKKTKEEDRVDISKDEVCSKMTHKIIEHVKMRFKNCAKQSFKSKKQKIVPDSDSESESEM